MLNKKQILIYTGDGKGKTSAALGLVVRALREKWHVLMVQFIKSNKESREKSLKKVLPKLKVQCFGVGFIIKKQINKKIKEENIKSAQRGIKFALQAANSLKYEVIVLDEILVAYNLKLIKLSDILEIIRAYKKIDKNLYLVLTGRNCPKSLYKYADLVTEMKEIKHPYQKGIQAVKGIDY